MRVLLAALALCATVVLGCGEDTGDDDIRATGRAYDRGEFGAGCVQFLTSAGVTYELVDGPTLTAEQVLIESDSQNDITLLLREVDGRVSACMIGQLVEVIAAEVACTTEVRSSVTVWVTGPDDTPLRGATVTYSVAGRQPQVADCIETGANDADCPVFSAGQEETGVFTITASLAGYVSDLAEVEVKSGLCHVRGEEVTLQLLPQ